MSMELALSAATRAAEEKLAVRVGLGDRAAFDEIVERYQNRLFRFAYRMLGDQSEAEDAVQEAFVRIYRALPGYSADGFFSSWVYRITLNECRRRLRQQKRHIQIELIDTPSWEQNPERRAIEEERYRQVRMAVEGLPETYRLVMMMFYYDNLTVEEIGKVMALSVSAVKVRLHRGRLRLLTRLNPDL